MIYLYLSILLFALLIYGYFSIKKDLKKIKELEMQQEQIIASQKVKKNLESINKKEEQKVVVVAQEKRNTCHLQANQIRYNLYDESLIKKWNLKKIYQELIIAKYNFNEPFYSAFFFILLVLDKNDIFMIASDTKFIYSNLRDESNNIIRTRSYIVFELSEIVSMTLIAYEKYMCKDTKKLDQQTMLAFCIYALQKADSHEVEDILLMIENIIGSDEYTNIENIIFALENKEPNAKLINDAFDQAIKRANRCPITDQGILYKCNTINIIEIPQKQLQFIQK